jgi:hypothetical protein
MQICGNAPEQSLAVVHLASSARAPTLMSALTAMIAAKSIELLVMISLPLMLFEKVMLPEGGKAIAVNRSVATPHRQPSCGPRRVWRQLSRKASDGADAPQSEIMSQ